MIGATGPASGPVITIGWVGQTDHLCTSTNVAAVLAAGLMRGPLCGALVMLGGGLLGFRLFLSHDGVTQPGAELALMMFWGVSAPVLVTANELRVQLKGAMDRLTAALQHHDRAAP